MKSPKWLLRKGATINPKNENDDECLWWSIISALKFENIFKNIKHEDKDFLIT